MRMVAKIEKWGRKVGSVSNGRPGIPAGTLYYMAYQKAAGSNKHSGHAGRRHYRFYAGQFGRVVAVKRQSNTKAAAAPPKSTP